jgi:hypothetical protein
VHGITDTGVLETTTGSQTKVDTHVNDTTDAHDASAISFVAGGTIAGTDVQTAVAEVATDAATALTNHNRATTIVHGIANTANLETTTGSQTKVDTHVNDTTDAHDASAISFSPAGTIAATDTQAAVAEVATDAASALSTHAADATIHSSGREIYHSQITSSQANITATGSDINDVTGLTVIIPAGGSRPIYLIGIVHVTHATAGAGVSISILPNAAPAGNGQGGGLLSLQISRATVPTIARQEEIYVEARLAPGVNGTYKLGAQVTAGTGTISATSIAPSIFRAVEA